MPRRLQPSCPPAQIIAQGSQPSMAMAGRPPVVVSRPPVITFSMATTSSSAHDPMRQLQQQPYATPPTAHMIQRCVLPSSSSSSSSMAMAGHPVVVAPPATPAPMATTTTTSSVVVATKIRPPQPSPHANMRPPQPSPQMAQGNNLPSMAMAGRPPVVAPPVITLPMATTSSSTAHVPMRQPQQHSYVVAQQMMIQRSSNSMAMASRPPPIAVVVAPPRPPLVHIAAAPMATTSTSTLPPMMGSSTTKASIPPVVGPFIDMRRQQAPPTTSTYRVAALPTTAAPPSMNQLPSLPIPRTTPPSVPNTSHHLHPTTSTITQTSIAPEFDLPRPPTTSPLIEFHTRINGQAAQPPSTTSCNFIVRDTGNCSPSYMRCTLSQVPCSRDLLASSGMPLALVVQPLALPHPSLAGEEEPTTTTSTTTIPTVHFGDSGPLRCGKCKAYINPFMKFMDKGHRFLCNFCGHTNDTPRDYLCSLGPDGRRQDADERPELCRGTIEFAASKDYQVRPPMAPLFFFLIDVSKNAVDSGATGAACSAIQRALADLLHTYFWNNNVKVGIATYDTTLHFYSFSESKQPSMLVVPDVEDVYAPLRPRLTVSATEYRDELEELLRTIPSMFQGTSIAGSAMGAAIKGASLVIRSNGGKLIVFQSGLPSVGFAALTAREPAAAESNKKGRAQSDEMEQNKLWQSNGNALRTLAIELAEHQICCDLFLTAAQDYVDIASLSVLPATTGGQVYYYHPFSATSDLAKLHNDLRWNLTRPQGLEAVMIVRCSQGLQVQGYSGNFYRRTPTDLDFPSIDCDKTVMVSLRYFGARLQEGSECCFQCALLYTTMDGRRSIRVSTLSLPCTTLIGDVFRGADLDAQFTYFAKQAASEASTRPLFELRDKLTDSCVNILHAYRESCSAATSSITNTSASSRQLLLPEALRLLPLYMLALTKSIGLRSSSDIRADDRCYSLSRMASISSSLAISAVYPRMYAIHDLTTKAIGGEGSTMLETLHLSSENLSSQGIYLLETGEDAFIYAGEDASEDVIYELFGVRSVKDNGEVVLREWDNDASRKLNALVTEIRKQERCCDLRLRWCGRRRTRDASSSESWFFFSLMVEDDHDPSLGLSYARYLAHLHLQIQHKATTLRNQRNEALIAHLVDS